MKMAAVAPCGAAVLLALSGPAGAQQTEIYFNDFEQGQPGPEWGAGKVLTKAANFTRFMGRFSTYDAIKLKLEVPEQLRSLPEGQSVQFGVTFDFYAIDSWDGSDPEDGIDRFQVLVDGSPWFDETFANVHKWQTFREPDIGRSHLGFNPQWKDSIYLGVGVPFLVGDGRDAFSITFRSRNLTGMDDESWGIDNVRVWYEVVPSPGAAPILALAAAPALRRRR